MLNCQISMRKMTRKLASPPVGALLVFLFLMFPRPNYAAVFQATGMNLDTEIKEIAPFEIINDGKKEGKPEIILVGTGRSDVFFYKSKEEFAEKKSDHLGFLKFETSVKPNTAPQSFHVDMQISFVFPAERWPQKSSEESVNSKLAFDVESSQLSELEKMKDSAELVNVTGKELTGGFFDKLHSYNYSFDHEFESKAQKFFDDFATQMINAFPTIAKDMILKYPQALQTYQDHISRVGQIPGVGKGTDG